MRPSKSHSETLVSLVTGNLIRLGGTYGKEITPPFARIWVDALEDLSLEEIAEGFKRVQKTFVPTSACPFPVPAHLRTQIDASRENLTNVRAEAGWEKALTWVRRYYRPDCRDKKYPDLGEQLWRSLGAAGGPAFVSDCSMDELAWAKKRFIEAYLSLEQLKRDQHFIGNGEAKQILASLIDTYTPKKIEAK